MRDTYMRGQAAPMPATAAAWQQTADELTVLQAIVRAEKALYGHVTAATATLLAERVAQEEAAVVIANAQGAARG